MSRVLSEYAWMQIWGVKTCGRRGLGSRVRRPKTRTVEPRRVIDTAYRDFIGSDVDAFSSGGEPADDCVCAITVWPTGGWWR
jgi:hypothetical protein